MKPLNFLYPIACALVLALAVPMAAPAVDLKVDSQEAEAALEILKKRRADEEPTPEDWERLFATEGFRRLGDRERSMDRPFGEEQFRTLLLSEEILEKASALESTLASWKAVDFASLAGQILGYLPEGAGIRATIYPVIKPKSNTFVFDLSGDPAIFLYLDPKVSQGEFTNTVLHELHHIGFGGSCPPPGVEEEVGGLPEGAQRALRWQAAFGEGFAMLAAAGGPDVHPHAESTAEERRRWDGDMTRFGEDLQKVQTFFLDLHAGRLDREKEVETARSFYGIQGPWYTVGWKMAATIEKAFGREALIGAFCDSRKLLETYNRAADLGGKRGKPPAKWSPQLLAALAGTPPTSPGGTSRP